MPAEDPRERYIAEDIFSVFRRFPEREKRIGGILQYKLYLGKRSLEMKKKILAIALSLAMVRLSDRRMHSLSSPVSTTFQG